MFIKDKNVYFIENNSNESILSICINVGSNQDLKNKSGLAHLSEHCLLYLRHDKNNVYSKNKFRFRGYTNFDHMVLKLYFPSELNKFSLCNNYVKSIFDLTLLNDLDFDIAKEEVISECICLSDHWQEQESIIQFLTRDSNKKLPVGVIEQVKKITRQEVVDFIQEYFIPSNIVSIFETSLSIEKISTMIPDIFCENRKEFSDKYIKKNSLNNENGDLFLLNLNSEMSRKFEIYFSKISTINLVEELIAESILASYVQEFFQMNGSDSNINITEKFIDINSCFIKLCVSDVRSDIKISGDMIKIGIRNLRKRNIKIDEIEQTKKSMIEWINRSVHSKEIFQYVFSLIYYGIPIILDDPDLPQKIMQANVEDIFVLYEKIMESDCWIIIR